MQTPIKRLMVWDNSKKQVAVYNGSKWCFFKKINLKKRATFCTAPKKLDTIWGYFYGKKSQI